MHTVEHIIYLWPHTVALQYIHDIRRYIHHTYIHIYIIFILINFHIHTKSQNPFSTEGVVKDREL